MMNAGKRLAGTPEPMLMLPTRDGLRIAADGWGPEHGRLVLLVHGGGQTRHAWRVTGRNLGANGYRAVAVDMRGHGDADWSEEGDYSQDALVRDLEDALVALTSGLPAVVVGASLSAGRALLAVGEGHVQASALVLFDFVPRTERAGFERLRTFMGRHPDGFASLEEVADAIGSFRGGAQRLADLSGLARVVRVGADGRYRWHWDMRQLAWRDREFSTRHIRLGEAARRVKVPALLVRGDGSDVVSEEGAREFLAQCPHAEYANIAGAGPMIAGDRNDRFGDALVPFLSRVTPADRSEGLRPDAAGG